MKSTRTREADLSTFGHYVSELRESDSIETITVSENRLVGVIYEEHDKAVLQWGESWEQASPKMRGCEGVCAADDVVFWCC